MEDQRFAVPRLWADHHILAVREALAALPGVENVDASAREREVTVHFDPGTTDGAAIAAALAAAGYPSEAADAPAAVPTNKPAWATGGARTVSTNPVDLTMSGDHRKY